MHRGDVHRFKLPKGVGHEQHGERFGVVVQAEEERVAVRIDEPGTYGEAIGGAELKKGEVIWDEPYGWTPCF